MGVGNTWEKNNRLKSKENQFKQAEILNKNCRTFPNNYELGNNSKNSK